MSEEKKILGDLENLDDTVRKKIINHRLEVEDNIYKNTWKSCCMEMDRRAVQYFTQIVIICSCMGFSIYQLLENDSCEAQQSYIGLLTLLIGILLPNPKFKEV